MRKWAFKDKWVMTSILYMAVVIGGFSGYEEFVAEKTQVTAAPVHSESGHGQEGESHSSHEGRSEIFTYIHSVDDEWI
ncbi:hypothetical protein [Ammoniphilus sp. 3BR4]|uniref:hypothetical protein n=1 Tax=Ammoniphilus sp. 3BR4 TaxID=3158265 RepID=UPI003465B3CF